MWCVASSRTTVAVGVPFGWLRKVRAGQAAVPRPGVLGVGGRVDAGVAVTGADEALKRGLLCVVEHVARGRVEHHQVVAAEERVREQRGVLGGIDGEVVLVPSCRIAAKAVGIAECRNAAVLEKTSTW